LLISGDFNLRRRSSAASLDLSLNLGDPASPPSPPPVDGAGEKGGALDPTDAIRRAVPMRGVLRGERGTCRGAGS